jgi:hypothetical protein
MSLAFDTPSDERPELLLWTSRWNERRSVSGLEHVRVQSRRADGVILGVDEHDQPFRIDYGIAWDERWYTRSVLLEMQVAWTSSLIRLESDGRGTWRSADGQDLPQFGGCFDIDVWPTPFTNTLAIRRLQLGLGERKEIEVVYVSALEQEIRKAHQAYTCVRDRDSYRFEAVGSDFAAELKVDRFGLVMEYPGLFSRVGPHADAVFDKD